MKLYVAMSLYDEDVQEFLKQNVKFLEDLQKVKLSVTLKKDRDELLRISNEWIFIPELQEEPHQPLVGEEPEETYDDDVGIYGEIGDDEEDEDIKARGEIQGEGAKILNLHASHKGWLREDGFFKSTRWWGLVYSKGGTSEIKILQNYFLLKSTKSVKFSKNFV